MQANLNRAFTKKPAEKRESLKDVMKKRKFMNQQENEVKKIENAFGNMNMNGDANNNNNSNNMVLTNNNQVNPKEFKGSNNQMMEE